MKTADDFGVSSPVSRPFGQGLAEDPKWSRVLQVVVILCFGALQSIALFGFKPVPNSDFVPIVRTGHELLSMQIPTSFTRAPLVGLLQACLSHVAGGSCPDLRAGWVLSGVLHPFGLLMFWLLARRIVGRAALWLTLIVAVNPYLLEMVVEPLIEIPLLFFCLLTLYLILIHSRWRYFFAAVTTMVRYEGAALIMVIFVMDMIESHERKQKLAAFGYSALAALPLIIWLLGTVMTWRSDSGHYLAVMFSEDSTKDVESFRISHSISKHIEVLWKVSIFPLLQLQNIIPRRLALPIWQVSKMVAGFGLISGVLFGLYHRRSGVLALLLFAVPYFLIHVAWSFLTERHFVCVLGIALILCWLGLQETRALIIRKFGPHRNLDGVFQILLVIASVVGFSLILKSALSMPAGNPRFLCMSSSGMVLVGLIFVGRVAVLGRKSLLRETAILTFMCLAILSSQVALGRHVRNGQTGKEFKLLAQWYMEHAHPPEKMLTSLPSMVTLFMPAHQDCIVCTSVIRADSPDGFAERCRVEGITYIAWDSRLGNCPENYYYRLWGLENIAMLKEPVSNSRYEYIARIDVDKERFINIFRVRPVGML